MGSRSHRRWRKLHLAFDADTQEIAAVELTTDDVGDVSALPDLLDQIEHPIGSVTADGAYDGDPVYDEVLQRHPTARVIIPPRATAVLSEAGTTQCDEHLRLIEAHGRIGWQHRVGYGKRSLVEPTMYRYKTIIGRRLHPSSGYSTGRPPLDQMKLEAEAELQPNLYSCASAWRR
jgi:transposase